MSRKISEVGPNFFYASYCLNYVLLFALLTLHADLQQPRHFIPFRHVVIVQFFTLEFLCGIVSLRTLPESRAYHASQTARTFAGSQSGYREAISKTIVRHMWSIQSEQDIEQFIRFYKFGVC